jgi:hypothetical protein
MLRNAAIRLGFGALVLAGAIATVAPAHGATENGRYKRQGDKCLWDATDSGPNQCTPVTAGRFKRSGKACSWSVAETGPDQCRPAHGRFKRERSGCVWTPGDDGPDQCDPHEAKSGE